jgi:hypothetical protein
MLPHFIALRGLQPRFQRNDLRPQARNLCLLIMPLLFQQLVLLYLVDISK